MFWIVILSASYLFAFVMNYNYIKNQPLDLIALFIGALGFAIPHVFVTAILALIISGICALFIEKVDLEFFKKPFLISWIFIHLMSLLEIL